MSLKLYSDPASDTFDNLIERPFELRADLPLLQVSETEIEAALAQLHEIKALERIKFLLQNLPDASTQMLNQLEDLKQRSYTGIKIA